MGSRLVKKTFIFNSFLNIAFSQKIFCKFVKFILGASPAKFMPLEDILKMNSSLEKMAIVHEIAIDKNFTVFFMKFIFYL